MQTWKSTLTATLLGAGIWMTALSATDAEETPSIQSDIRCENWQAKAISRSKESRDEKPAYVELYRKEFSVGEAPESAVIHLSALGGKFKLYLNGRFVNDGPPRTHYQGTPYYCSYEVGSYLQPGANVVAVEANGWALQAQLEFRDAAGAVVQTMATDEDWKVAPSPWQTTGHDFHVPGGGTEIYLAREEPRAWKQVGYDDAQWESAKPSPGSELVRSDLPPLVREVRLPATISFQGEVTEMLGAPPWHEGVGFQMATEIPLPAEKTSIENAAGLMKKDGGPAIVEYQYYVNDQEAYDTYWDNHDDMPVLRSATLIVDFGELRNGFISLDIEGSGGTVDIGWGQTLIDGRVHTLPRLWREGLQHYACRYVMAQGRRQWEAFNYQSFRYLQLTFRNLRGPVKLHRIAAVRSEQPLAARGKFTCSDPLLNKFFTSNEKTFRATSYHLPMDNTIREKVVWGGDVADAIVPTCLSIFGDVPMLRHYFAMFAGGQEVIGTGTLPDTGTGATSNYLAHPIKTAIRMADFGFWCRDPEYYQSHVLPALTRHVDYLMERVDDRGLLVLEGKENNWVDHVRRDRCDVSVPINLEYAYLLRHAADVNETYGNAAKARQWRNALQVVLQSIRNEFWDEAAGLYRDGALDRKLCPTFSTHANYLALACGLGADGRKERILAALNDPARAGQVIDFGAPFYFWPHEALFAIGEARAALDLMRNRYSRFYRNEDGGDTFWEEASYVLGGHTWSPRYRSLSQLGSGSPAWFLHREILGVKPAKHGFAEFSVEPKPCDLDWAEGVVPSPAGNISVRWEKKDGEFALTINVPEGTTAQVKLPDTNAVQTLHSGDHTLKVAVDDELFKEGQ
jgi:hypothetical protein